MEEWKVTAIPSALKFQKVVGWTTSPNGNFGTLFLPFFRKWQFQAAIFAIFQATTAVASSGRSHTRIAASKFKTYTLKHFPAR